MMSYKLVRACACASTRVRVRLCACACVLKPAWTCCYLTPARLQVMSKATTRKERRIQQRQHYLAGEARHPYRHTPALSEAFSHGESSSSSSTTGPTVCAKCKPILSRYEDTFKGLVHQESELKKRKKVNPHPKKPSTIHYRDINAQNDWLRENLFDPMGNYLYCAACICASLRISKQRLARQRHIKRQQSQQPLVEMTKAAVEREDLGQYVVMPSDLEIAFKQWWRSLDSTVLVNVKYPHERHGNAGKPSHFAKTSVKEDFLAFVDVNSQPNGRSADSTGPTYYFLSKFSTIQAPKHGVSNYEHSLQRSLVGEFNRTQAEAGKQGCSNGSSHNWLKAERPKHAICPHKQDYCDTTVM